MNGGKIGAGATNAVLDAAWDGELAFGTFLFTGRQNIIGTPETVAATIDEYVQADASDGFILVPHITPDGLGEFADKVVPILQERGVFRTEYEGTTLREHLGLAVPTASQLSLAGGASTP